MSNRVEKFMFSPVRMWLVLLLCLTLLVFAVMNGTMVFRTLTQPGTRFTSETAVEISKIPHHAIELLELGIRIDEQGRLAGGFPQVTDFADFAGVKLEEPGFEEKGLMLISSFSLYHKIPTIFLYDIGKDETLWEWIPDYDEIVEKTPTMKQAIEAGTYLGGANRRSLFRSQHPLLLDDGSILITSGNGVLVKLDPMGNVVWTSDKHYHHSIHQMPDGSFIVPIIISRGNDWYRNDGYGIVSPGGELTEGRSITEILEANGYRGLILGVGRWETDRIHLNDAEPIHKSDEFVQEGDLMFSCRNISTVFLYRPSENKVVWLQTGPWLAQHDVDYLGDGMFAVFGNDVARGVPQGVQKGYSSLYFYNQATGEITEPYKEVFKENRLLTPTQGLQRILRNGDAFVSITDSSQLLRISPEGIRWRFVNPVDEGKIGSLHWSRYFYPDELNLDWLKELKAKTAKTKN